MSKTITTILIFLIVFATILAFFVNNRQDQEIEELREQLNGIYDSIYYVDENGIELRAGNYRYLIPAKEEPLTQEN